MLRKLLVSLHRWIGLATAVFLFIAGLTGALIGWNHELDSWLNPQLFSVSAAGRTPLTALEIAQRVEREDPRLQVTWLPLAVEDGNAIDIRVAARPGVPGLTPDFDQVMLDPYTGARLGQRMWGEFSLTRETIIPFIYKLHYTLQLPATGGVDIGTLLMGIIGIAWALDCCISLWISFPSFASWRKSFAFRWAQGGPKLVFDLHRSGGVWLWGLLLIMAVTSVSMNLPYQVARPLLGKFSELAPDPFQLVAPTPAPGPLLAREEVVDIARRTARERGWQAPAGGIFYSAVNGIYGVGFYAPGNDHADGSLGNIWAYFDAYSGELRGASVPGSGSAGDVFMQAQFPLHSGRILGMSGRILVSCLGVLIAVLSLTGVLIWARRRRARATARQMRPMPTPAIKLGGRDAA